MKDNGERRPMENNLQMKTNSEASIYNTVHILNTYQTFTHLSHCFIITVLKQKVKVCQGLSSFDITVLLFLYITQMHKIIYLFSFWLTLLNMFLSSAFLLSATWFCILHSILLWICISQFHYSVIGWHNSKCHPGFYIVFPNSVLFLLKIFTDVSYLLCPTNWHW